MHLAEGYTVLNISGNASNYWFLLGHKTILPRGDIVNLTPCDKVSRDEELGVSNNHEIIVSLKPFPSQLRCMKIWSIAISFAFIPGFTFCGYF